MTAIAVDPRPQPEADIWSPSIDGVGAVLGRLLTKLWHHYNEKRGYLEMGDFRGVENEACGKSKKKNQWSARHNIF